MGWFGCRTGSRGALVLVLAGALVSFVVPVQTSWASEPAPDLEVRGNAVLVPDGDTSPSPHDHTHFGPVLTNAAVTRTFTLRNTGSGDATNLSIFFESSPRHSVVTPSTVPRLAPGEAIPLTVSIDPASIGTQFGEVFIVGANLREAYTFAVAVTAVDCAPGSGNPIVNPELSGGTAGWSFHGAGSGFAAVETGTPCGTAGRLDVNAPSSTLQLFQSGVPLESGATYTLMFRMRSSSGHDVRLRMDRDTSPFTNYGLNQRLDLTNEWETFATTFTAKGFEGTTTDSRLKLWLAPYATAGDEYALDSVLLTRAAPPRPLACNEVAGNLLRNGGFEGGPAPWAFFTNGAGSFAVTGSDPFDCANAARVTITKAGSNTQLYQPGVALEEGARYRLRFAARSTAGRDMGVALQRHTAPYTSYGLLVGAVNLTSAWTIHSYEFTARGFDGTASDGRLRFVFGGHAVDGTQYFIDDVSIVEIT